MLNKSGDWWTGRLRGHEGIFPVNFVKPVSKNAAGRKLLPVPAPAAAPAPAAPGPGLTLVQLKEQRASGVLDRAQMEQLEQMLSDDEFVKTLGVSRVEFNALPKWKQNNKKKEAGLF